MLKKKSFQDNMLERCFESFGVKIYYFKKMSVCMYVCFFYFFYFFFFFRAKYFFYIDFSLFEKVILIFF